MNTLGEKVETSTSARPSPWTHRAVLLGVLGTIGAIPGSAQPGRSAGESPTPAHYAGRTQLPAPGKLPQRVTLTVRDSSMAYVLLAIARQSNLRLWYDKQYPVYAKRITVDIKQMPALEAFAKVLEGTGFSATMASDGETVIVKQSTTSTTRASETGDVSGRVVDSVSGEGVSGVTIAIQGTRVTAVTGRNGDFSLANIPAGTHIVTFKMLGYASATRTIQVQSGKSAPLRVSLRQVPSALSGVVTTATGTQRKLEVGNSIVTLNVDSLMQTAPIRSVTELLETRVPGLAIQRTTGSPGDPARLRLRGTSSINANNDPIVVVDGIRIYAAQSDTYNQNLAPGQAKRNSNSEVPVPSPLDQIDPNSIETIEVFKGPSASAMYGSDAANGVIVITTKRGRSGPPKWSVNTTYGRSALPGKYPLGTYRYGTTPDLVEQLCYITDLRCRVDSVRQFQALSDPRMTVLGTGHEGQLSSSVRGGTQALQYALTASASNNLGMLKLPAIEADRFQKLQGIAPPSWLRRPDRYDTWSGQATITAEMTPTLRFGLTSMVFHSAQQRTQLSLNGVSQLLTKRIDTVTNPNDPILTNAYEKITAKSLSATHTLQSNWQPAPWLPLSASLGFNLINRADEALKPWGTTGVAADTSAAYGTGRGNTLNRTVNVNTNIPLFGARTMVAVGLNYVTGSVESMSANNTAPLPRGVTVPNSSLLATQTTSERTTFGWFIEPRLNLKSRFFASPGFRLDNNGLAGNNARLLGLPKMNFSWIASEESFFPWKDQIPMLRLRAGVGTAGVQPGATDRLRSWRVISWGNRYDGTPMPQFVNSGYLTGVGNTHLRPERSTEFEGGADLDLWSGRISLVATGYQKKRYDAIVSIPLAASTAVDVNASLAHERKENIGVIKNTGMEFSANAQLIERRSFSWNATVNMNRNANIVTRLNAGRSALTMERTPGIYTRITPGYPLLAQWAKPILGYADANGNKIIDRNEIVLGDSAVYLGPQEPTMTLGASTGVTMFNGRLLVNANFSYIGDMAQINGPMSGEYSPFNLAGNDPNAPFALQAASVAARERLTTFGTIQTVNSYRFETLSVSYLMPTSAAALFRSRAMRLALLGRNLGLKSNYTGKDPNVNSFATGNATNDSGVLPQPRVWSLRVTLEN